MKKSFYLVFISLIMSAPVEASWHGTGTAKNPVAFGVGVDEDNVNYMMGVTCGKSKKNELILLLESNEMYGDNPNILPTQIKIKDTRDLDLTTTGGPNKNLDGVLNYGVQLSAKESESLLYSMSRGYKLKIEFTVRFSNDDYTAENSYSIYSSGSIRNAITLSEGCGVPLK